MIVPSVLSTRNYIRISSDSSSNFKLSLDILMMSEIDGIVNQFTQYFTQSFNGNFNDFIPESSGKLRFKNRRQLPKLGNVNNKFHSSKQKSYKIIPSSKFPTLNGPHPLIGSITCKQFCCTERLEFINTADLRKKLMNTSRDYAEIKENILANNFDEEEEEEEEKCMVDNYIIDKGKNTKLGKIKEKNELQNNSEVKFDESRMKNLSSLSPR